MSVVSVPVSIRDARSYEVRIGPGTLTELGRRCAELLPEARRAFLIVDEALPEPWVDRARDALAAAGVACVMERAHASETEKSMRTVTRLLESVCGSGLERFEPVIGLGGGIVTDVAGYVAASYRRGVPVIQCPTTLLSMVDASTGGKTGVNLDADGRLLKNMAGAFHQPIVVLADTDTLATLPDRVLRAGFGECAKHALLADSAGEPELLTETGGAAALIGRGTAPDAGFIARGVRVKAAIIQNDERETDLAGGRALLNLGHTFAHAIETIPELSPGGAGGDAPLQHGEAVSLGLVAAANASLGLGLCEPSLIDVVAGLLEPAGLPVKIAGLPANDELLERVQMDKKSLAGSVRLVLPTSPGRAEVRAVPDADAVIRGFDAIRA